MRGFRRRKGAASLVRRFERRREKKRKRRRWRSRRRDRERERRRLGDLKMGFFDLILLLWNQQPKIPPTDPPTAGAAL